jgi:hypothetical protein
MSHMLMPPPRSTLVLDDLHAQRCWVAMDRKSGEPVMRLHDWDLLPARVQEPGVEGGVERTAAEPKLPQRRDGIARKGEFVGANLSREGIPTM